MSIDFGKAPDKFDAVMSTNGGGNDMVQGGGVFTVTCHDADGNLKWEDGFHNKVPVQGLQYMNASFLTCTASSLPAPHIILKHFSSLRSLSNTLCLFSITFYF